MSVNLESNKQCRVCSASSWVQSCLPINYNELVKSKKSDYKLTNEAFCNPNICCMDRNESNIIMFMKKKEFRMFTLDSGKLIQDLDFDAEF